MNTFYRVIAAAVTAAAIVFIWAALQRWESRRRLSKIISAVRAGEQFSKPLMERSYVVEVSSAEVRCDHPDGTIESVQWSGLQKVELLTDEVEPYLPGQFWVLHGSNSGCVIPIGATGAEDLLRKLQLLPGFKNELIVDAASLTANNRRICWEAQPSTGPE